jgi:hypothetical protein
VADVKRRDGLVRRPLASGSQPGDIFARPVVQIPSKPKPQPPKAIGPSQRAQRLAAEVLRNPQYPRSTSPDPIVDEGAVPEKVTPGQGGGSSRVRTSSERAAAVAALPILHLSGCGTWREKSPVIEEAAGFTPEQLPSSKTPNPCRSPNPNPERDQNRNTGTELRGLPSTVTPSPGSSMRSGSAEEHDDAARTPAGKPLGESPANAARGDGVGPRKAARRNTEEIVRRLDPASPLQAAAAALSIMRGATWRTSPREKPPRPREVDPKPGAAGGAPKKVLADESAVAAQPHKGATTGPRSVKPPKGRATSAGKRGPAVAERRTEAAARISVAALQRVEKRVGQVRHGGGGQEMGAEPAGGNAAGRGPGADSGKDAAAPLGPGDAALGGIKRRRDPYRWVPCLSCPLPCGLSSAPM